MITYIAIAGASGSGKTTSLRNLPQDKTVIISPFKQDVPFKNTFTKLNSKDKTGNLVTTANILHLPSVLKHIVNDRPDIEYVVIDDITHYQTKIISSDEFRARSKGGEAFARYVDFAGDMISGLIVQGLETDRNLFVIHMYHDNTNQSTGERKIKLAGTLLEEKFDIPSYYNYVFYTKVLPVTEDHKSAESRYKLIVNSDGTCDAKSPLGLFDDIMIPNDMNSVINKIKEFKNIK
jgi:hypothetical protein